MEEGGTEQECSAVEMHCKDKHYSLNHQKKYKNNALKVTAQSD